VGRDLPAHLIVPADLADAARALGWPAGVHPDGDAPVWRMDRVKSRLLDAFARPGETPVAETRSAPPDG
jgi:hypothetical protein